MKNWDPHTSLYCTLLCTDVLIRTIALRSSGRRSLQIGKKSPPSADFHLWEGEWPGLEVRGVTAGRLWGGCESGWGCSAEKRPVRGDSRNGPKGLEEEFGQQNSKAPKVSPFSHLRPSQSSCGASGRSLLSLHLECCPGQG